MDSSTTTKHKQVEEHLDDTELNMSDDESESSDSPETTVTVTKKKLTADENKPDPNEVGWPTDYEHLTVVEC